MEYKTWCGYPKVFHYYAVCQRAGWAVAYHFIMQDDTADRHKAFLGIN